MSSSRQQQALLVFTGVVIASCLLGYLYFCYRNESNQKNLQIQDLSDQIKQLASDFAKLKSSQDLSFQSYDALSNKYDDLKIHNLQQQQLNDAIYDSLKRNVTDLYRNRDDYHVLLMRLSNHTTNADIMDGLNATRIYVDQRIESSKKLVDDAVSEISENVSSKLNATSTRVEVTLGTMQSVLVSAKSEIYRMQQNMTTQLNDMSNSIALAKDRLNDEVNEAQDTIETEVNAVREDIKQYIASTNEQFNAENDFVKHQLAGTFTLLGCLISLWHFTSHLRHYHKPRVQRRVMAVLWMVPIYGITSWLSLIWPRVEPFLSSIRDCYEAYAVYTFIAILCAILEDGRGLKGLLEKLVLRVKAEREELIQYNSGGEWNAAGTKKPKSHMTPPFRCCYVDRDPISVAAAWLYQCRLLAIQFVIMKPVLTVAPILFKLAGFNYDLQPLFEPESHMINWKAAKLYIIILQNISVGLAFYGLLRFYHGTEIDLAWCNPWPKFLCIKGVVFMTFWQGLGLQLMASIGWVDEKAASQIQNLLICVEMLLASLAHFYIFPYYEWSPGYREAKEQEHKSKVRIRDTMALPDFFKDVQMMNPYSFWDKKRESGSTYTSNQDRDLSSPSSDGDNIEFKYSSDFGSSSIIKSPASVRASAYNNSNNNNSSSSKSPNKLSNNIINNSSVLAGLDEDSTDETRGLLSSASAYENYSAVIDNLSSPANRINKNNNGGTSLNSSLNSPNGSPLSFQQLTSPYVSATRGKKKVSKAIEDGEDFGLFDDHSDGISNGVDDSTNINTNHDSHSHYHNSNNNHKTYASTKNETSETIVDGESVRQSRTPRNSDIVEIAHV